MLLQEKMKLNKQGYDEYLKADITDKQIMIVKNILASIKTISRKAKIDYKQF